MMLTLLFAIICFVFAAIYGFKAIETCLSGRPRHVEMIMGAVATLMGLFWLMVYFMMGGQ